MSVRDPFSKRFIFVGKRAIARFSKACYVGNDCLQCIFHIIETNLQGRCYEDFQDAG